jgi:hypothetical protein
VFRDLRELRVLKVRMHDPRIRAGRACTSCGARGRAQAKRTYCDLGRVREYARKEGGGRNVERLMRRPRSWAVPCWSAVEAEAPELAALACHFLDAHVSKTLATLRRDGGRIGRRSVLVSGAEIWRAQNAVISAPEVAILHPVCSSDKSSPSYLDRTQERSVMMSLNKTRKVIN